MWTGRGRPERKSANASWTASTASVAAPRGAHHSAIAPDHRRRVLGLVEGADVAELAPSGTPGDRMISGRDSQYAVPVALIAF